MNTTDAQRLAIEAEGDVLVAAGAGAGKTSTLVARCVRLIASGCSLENFLMVTFTEAAAAEMRTRIRKALGEMRSAAADSPLRISHSALDEQLALLDAVPISTLHSFCFQIVRRHFHELDLDPQLTVLDEAQGAVLMEETLDELFRRHYADEGAPGGALEQLILAHAGGREEPVRDLILKIHRYTQTQPDPGAWIDVQLNVLRDRDPTMWRAWLLEALQDWRGRWSGVLRAQPAEGTAVRDIAAQLETLGADAALDAFAAVLEKIPRAETLKPKQRPPAAFLDETAFLRSVTVARNGVDPLAQDWEWARGGMETLLLLAREFAEMFATTKREQAAVDFNDLEQFALRLLWDATAAAPTEFGRAQRAQFHHVFVDECQDINAAQDAIIRAVSRDATGQDSPTGNRFLVGDVKQSIYRFRLADPRIFQGYEARWRGGGGGRVISLSDNFRSREALLDFFNAVFADLMQPEIGRVQFDGAARLQFGNPAGRHALSKGESPGPRVHLHLRLTSPATGPADDDADSDLAELSGAEHEARIVANRLRELRDGGHMIWKDHREQAVDWGDMAVLLRSPKAKAEIYAREFARQSIPLEVATSDFFDTLEVTDLLSVLMLLDNPLQDVPLLAVLHSPLAGFTPDELAEVRLAQRGGYFWTALNRFHDTERASPTWPKADQFLERFARWRRIGRDAALGPRLETILAETHYLDWLAAHAANPQRAEQRLANVRRLLTLAQQFDPFQRQGVPRFLRFVEAQRAVAGREPLAAGGGAVQLISIHRSKGLEYPVVVVPDLGKRFNLDDLKADIVVHERLGLCPRIKPPHAGRRYPSLPHWLYAQRERVELLGEEMRLLYVALTRARDTLLLVGTAARKRAVEVWPERSASPAELLASSSMLEWLGPWFTHRAGGGDWLQEASGRNGLFSWRFYSEEEAPVRNGVEPRAVGETPAQNWAGHEATLTWNYPFEAATRESAKTSVSALRRKLSESAEEARPWWRGPVESDPRVDGLSAAEAGTAHHTFLEFADLAKLPSEQGVAAEAARLVETGVLSGGEAQHLNQRRLAQFWSSDLGQKLLAELPRLHRELPFTVRFTATDLRELGLATGALPAGEFVVVQGVADLAVILPGEIWLMDFKTDEVASGVVEARAKYYAPQMQAYSAALERIYARKVTQRWLHFLTPGMTAPV
jgi:ATP-dependent helicase/nuclease subunit A